MTDVNDVNRWFRRAAEEASRLAQVVQASDDQLQALVITVLGGIVRATMPLFDFVAEDPTGVRGYYNKERILLRLGHQELALTQDGQFTPYYLPPEEQRTKGRLYLDPHEVLSFFPPRERTRRGIELISLLVQVYEGALNESEELRIGNTELYKKLQLVHQLFSS